MPDNPGTQPPPWAGLPDDALDALAPALPALAAELVDAIRAEVPSFGRPLEGEFGQIVRGGVAQALLQFEQMARNPGVGREVGRSVYVELGRGEVREGRPLDALLAAYRVGAKVAWRRLAETGAAAGLTTETLILLAESIFAYIDELSAESAEGYAQEQAERAGEADRRRAVLIDLLLQRPAAPAEDVDFAAQRARWEVPRELAVVVWHAARGGRRLVAALPPGSIATLIDGHMVVIVPDPVGPGRRDQLEQALDGVAAGVGTVLPVTEAARSRTRAVAALALAEARAAGGGKAGTGMGGPAAAGGPLFADEHRVDLLLHADPPLVAEISGELLAPLAGESPISRERLAETLLAWLRHDRNATAAADALHVHAQTVRYRLARLRELFGDALDDPDLRFTLELVLRAGAAPAAVPA
jgi:hypothetical protein